VPSFKQVKLDLGNDWVMKTPDKRTLRRIDTLFVVFELWKEYTRLCVARPPEPCFAAQGRCATRLRYAPNSYFPDSKPL